MALVSCAHGRVTQFYCWKLTSMQVYVDFAARHWELFALLALVIVLIIGNEVYRYLRGTASVGVSEALRLHNHEDAALVDIREVAEFREGHIPAARNIPLPSFKTKLADIKLAKDRPIIVYCRSGNRAPSATSMLRKQGYDRAYNLSGGLLAWEQANLPISKGRK